MFEHKKEKLIPQGKFIRRQLRYSLYALYIVVFSLLLGISGYMVTAGLGLTDALLNASMILTGMGPVDLMRSESSKLFASFYALYSGIAFLTTIGVFIAPILHRFLHSINLEE